VKPAGMGDVVGADSLEQVVHFPLAEGRPRLEWLRPAPGAAINGKGLSSWLVPAVVQSAAMEASRDHMWKQGQVRTRPSSDQ
jgi:hypothetical protein